LYDGLCCATTRPKRPTKFTHACLPGNTPADAAKAAPKNWPGAPEPDLPAVDKSAKLSDWTGTWVPQDAQYDKGSLKSFMIALGLPGFVAGAIASGENEGYTWALTEDGTLYRYFGKKEKEKDMQVITTEPSKDKFGNAYTVTLVDGVLTRATGGFKDGECQSKWWLSGPDKTVMVEWGGFDGCFYFARIYKRQARLAELA